MRYEGITCEGCGVMMTPDDDVVVCPDCGTPQHRACYEKEHACVNSALHGTDFSFTMPVTEEKEAPKNAEDDLICPKCQTRYTEADEFCPSCNYPVRLSQMLHTANHIPNDYDYSSEVSSNIEIHKEHLEAFVGKNKYYYLRKFYIMKELRKKISFNLAAFFFPYLYFPYRKMWLLGIVSFIVKCATSLVSNIATLAEFYEIDNVINYIEENAEMFSALSDTSWICSLIFSVFCGFFANYAYYRKSCKSIISTVKRMRNQDVPTPDSAILEELSYKGGVNTIGTIVFFMIGSMIYSYLIAKYLGLF